MTDKYHLKWNSHHEEAFENFHLLRDREIFTDVTLSCEGQIMKAHRVILSAGSAYFERTLPRDSSHTPIVYFHGIPMAKLRLVIEFIYSGAVEVPSPDLEKFIELSECLEVKGLKSRPRSSSNPSTSQRTESSSGKSSASASPPPATKHQSTTSTQSSQPAKKLKLAQDLSKAEPQPEKNEETDSTIAVNNVKDEHNDEVSLKEEEILGMGDEAQDEQYDDSSPGEDTGALPSDSMELSLTSDEVPQNIPPEISPEMRLNESMWVGRGPQCVKVFFCEFCSYVTDHKGHAVDHNTVHTGKKPFPCELCDKSFLRPSHLSRHLSKRHGVPILQS